MNSPNQIITYKSSNFKRSNFLLICNSLFFTILFLSSFTISAQYQLNGSAILDGEDCFQLTPEEEGQAGSVWFTDKLNLENSFDLQFQINLGCKNSGADGIVFGLQAESTSIGTAGFGMGFAGVNPSLGIEFDTYQNNDQFDPSYDHMAININGSVSHDIGQNPDGPIVISSTDDNVEDCELHEVRVSWDAPSQTLKVYFECILRLRYKSDIVAEIFGGNPEVFWGFTAATGAGFNTQVICLKDINFITPLEDIILCPGGEWQLEAPAGYQYQWSPEESLNNPYIQNPIARPNSTTSYSLIMTDDCNIQFYDTLSVFIDGIPAIFSFQDTTLCDGNPLILDATINHENVIYEWSEGSTNPSISPSSSGNYSVTVTVDDYCLASNFVSVNFLQLNDIIFPETSSICENETILLDATFPDAHYLWQDGSEISVFEVREEGDYAVTVTHFCGTKVLESSIILEESCSDVFIPNAFSPNADGINDFLMIQDGGDIVEVLQFKIFDRWGAIIFEAYNFPSNDRNYAWDGTHKEESLPPGVFMYFAEVLFRNGEKVLLTGDITLFK